MRKESVRKILFWCGTLLGSAFFCIFFPSAHWRDTVHIIYDLTVSPLVSAYVTGVLLDGIYGERDEYWWARLLLIIPALLIPTGRRFLGWPISGHLTAMLIVAPAISFDRRLSRIVRTIYWLPLPYVLYLRWFSFDKDDHWQTYNCIIIAAASLLIVKLALIFYKLTKEKSSTAIKDIQR